MTPPPRQETDLLNTFVKSAQYIMGLSSHQDLWDHLGKLVVTYFHAQWAAFVQQDPAGGLSIDHCVPPGAAACSHLLADNVRAVVKDVLDSGFLASQVVAAPGPSMTAFLPIGGEQQPRRVLLIGHDTAEPLPGELLNIYLALAGLAGTMLERLHVEAELNIHRAHLEELVQARTEELERSNKELQQFAYIASHDLQEPLRMVTGFMGLLRERCDEQLDDKAREYIQFAVDGAGRMSNLIVDLLEYSRVQAKERQQLATDMKAVLDHAMANCNASLAETGTVVTCDELPTVMGDQTELTQLLQNLIGNAVKFRRPDMPQAIHVGVCRDAGRWLFSVHDKGIGIPQDQLERIFRIFQRLHTREQYPGTGIGLAICKKIVERHGGRIWAESKPGEGSTFCFTLPQQVLP